MSFARLQLVVFLTGAAFMGLEIIGSRLIAPYLGTSVIVWTSLIGVALLSLSLGYFWGGKLADKNPSEVLLSNIVAVSATYVSLLIISKDFVISLIAQNISDLRIASIAAVCFVLLIPSVLLGMVSPFAIKLAAKNLKNVGQTSGNLYAISTFGSIVGTFCAGFVLISFLGHTQILILIVVTLVVASILIIGKIRYFQIIAIVMVLISFFASQGRTNNLTASGFFDIDTLYNRVFIYGTKEPDTQKNIKVMVFDPRFVQSAIFEDSDDLVFEVYRQFRLYEHFMPTAESALMIGGAAYTFPRFFLEKNMEAKMDVVEIDPGLTVLAKQHFRLEDDARLGVYHEDARNFLNREVKNAQKNYDVIFEDAFSSANSVPFQLSTIEAVGNIYNLLSRDGVAIVNLISALEGEKSKFLWAQYWTYREVFPQVYIFPVGNRESGEVQNILLVAMKNDKLPQFESQDTELSKYLEGRYEGENYSEKIVFTDDFAPVDEYLMPILAN